MSLGSAAKCMGSNWPRGRKTLRNNAKDSGLRRIVIGCDGRFRKPRPSKAATKAINERACGVTRFCCAESLYSSARKYCSSVSALGWNTFEVGSSPPLFTCQAGVIKRVLLGFHSYLGIVQSLPATWIKDRDRRPL